MGPTKGLSSGGGRVPSGAARFKRVVDDMTRFPALELAATNAPGFRRRHPARDSAPTARAAAHGDHPGGVPLTERPEYRDRGQPEDGLTADLVQPTTVGQRLAASLARLAVEARPS
jgi:hypothetical protein